MPKTVKNYKRNVMRRIRVLRRWDNDKERPTPIYYFYPKGKAEDKGYTLSEGLRRFPETKWHWVMINEN